MNTWTNQVFMIALAGLLTAVNAILALLSSSLVMPSIPLINGRIDLWYVSLVIGMMLIPKWPFKLALVLTTFLILIPIEVSSYAGFGDYVLEVGAPLVFLAPLGLPLVSWKAKLAQLIGTIILFTGARLFFITLAGVVFYEVSWEASAIFNAPNIGVDASLLFVATPFVFLKLRRALGLAPLSQ